MHTPWGDSQTNHILAPGIEHVSTASHGGFFLDPDRNTRVPEAWRNASFNGRARQGWYEEDCDWCLVALAYPHLFPPKTVETTRMIFDAFFAPKIAA